MSVLSIWWVLASSQDPPATGNQWLLYGMAAITIIYVAFVRPMRKQKKDPLAKPPVQMSLAQHRAVERQMETLLVDLSEMARQITAQLDTRAAKLEALIGEADERIAAMKDAPPKEESIAPRAVLPPIDPRHAEVYRLADAGLPNRDIAQQLNRPSGEIELILALRPRT
jgi:hypothetical protein